jgi:hypothetical protein
VFDPGTTSAGRKSHQAKPSTAPGNLYGKEGESEMKSWYDYYAHRQSVYKVMSGWHVGKTLVDCKCSAYEDRPASSKTYYTTEWLLPGTEGLMR